MTIEIDGYNCELISQACEHYRNFLMQESADPSNVSVDVGKIFQLKTISEYFQEILG